MTYNQMPKAQGLYRPEFEHDACGIGLYAHLKGKQTHDIVKQGLKMLCQLDHRGGQGSDPDTGDGAGLLVQILMLSLGKSAKTSICRKRALQGRNGLFLTEGR